MDETSDIRIVQAGRQFPIDLEAMPGAGYMWELAAPPQQIELVSQEVISFSEAIGGSSTQRFVLVAKVPGSYQLAFQLKRKWEEQPVKTHLLSIHAQ